MSLYVTPARFLFGYLGAAIPDVVFTDVVDAVVSNKTVPDGELSTGLKVNVLEGDTSRACPVMLLVTVDWPSRSLQKIEMVIVVELKGERFQ